MLRFYKIVFLLLSMLICWSNALPQFYSGHQMNFGKNRVQYGNFDWNFYRYNPFDTYFYSGGQANAIQVAQIANKVIPELEKFLDYKIEQRLIFVVYNNLSDFRQSNIGLNTGDSQYNIGGVTRIVDNIVFLYAEGDSREMEIQIRGAIAEVMLNEMLYGSGFTSKIANNTLISVPDWFFSGLVSYISNKWDYEIDNYVKDGILSGKFEQFNHLSGKDAQFAGHSIWYFVANNYGENVIPTIVYLTRVTKNVENGFQYVLGNNLKMLAYDWLNYYQALYTEHDLSCDKNVKKNILKPRFGKWELIQTEISDNGNYIAYSIKNMGKYKIVLYETASGKTKTILTKEHKLEQIVDYSYPVIGWHPTGKLLGYIIESNGEVFYCTYNLETKKTLYREISLLQKVLSFSYSHDGLKLVMSGYKNGMSDIYIFNIVANTITNMTDDIADDYSPQFIEKSSKILFSSNRASDTLVSGKTNVVPMQTCSDIFIMDADGKNNVLKRVTKTKDINEAKALSVKTNEFWYLANDNGIYNRYYARYDSVISYIDTATHYRYITRSFPITNYPRNIGSYDVAARYPSVVESIFENDRWGIYLSEISRTPYSGNVTDTRFRTVDRENLNFVPQPKPEKPVKPIQHNELDNIDINNYSFSQEVLQTTRKESGDFDSLGVPLRKFQQIYVTTFYTNYVVNQIDFGFLNSSYQQFTGSAFYFNPGFNILFKLGAKDLFEDYRITGGVRFSANFDSNEYLLSFEDLKKRLDRQYIFHRMTINSSNGYNIIKSNSHELLYVLRYPFNQVSSVQLTLSGRHDKMTDLSLDYFSLLSEPEYNYWAGTKLEYIFDNTLEKQINIYNGFRYKVFAEYYRQIDKKQSDLIVFGGDFRYYLPLHRNLIIAARVAASGSAGRSKLIYYLGGIDNWINFSTKTPTFDNTVRIDPDKNYVYQAVATNMRGFSQNVRNGTNFAVLNAEIRWPLVSYILNRPLNSAFLQNLQLIGFFDMGCAWSGLNPFSGDNAFDNDVYENYPVTVIIDNNNYPIVAGYGVGVRSKLFGYFIRADWAWGIENNRRLPGIFYLSLNLDF
ncbi:MAG TPA: hypothetical protein PLP11_07560 [Bacteroidales bacterium]|nr:hypothetical protein [Bacteroidales bacterium]